AGIGGGRASHHAVDGHRDGAARLGCAAEGRRGVVGGVAAAATEARRRGRGRSGSIDRQVKGVRRRAGVDGRGGGGESGGVVGVAQRVGRGNAPVAVGVGGSRAGRHAVDVHRDGAAWLGRAAEGRRVVVGEVAAAAAEARLQGRGRSGGIDRQVKGIRRRAG